MSERTLFRELARRGIGSPIFIKHENHVVGATDEGHNSLLIDPQTLGPAAG